MVKKFAHLFGIDYPPSLFVFLGFILILFLVLTQSLILSKHDQQITRLTQKMALLNEEISKLDTKNENEGS